LVEPDRSNVAAPAQSFNLHKTSVFVSFTLKW
jgi:hypothetical protein